jgi:putative transposase
MINQDLEAAIAQLQELIDLHSDARKVRKALAAKLVYLDYLYEEIQTILDVSIGSSTVWKQNKTIAKLQTIIVKENFMIFEGRTRANKTEPKIIPGIPPKLG